MNININHQLREKISHDATNFPISFFHDELVSLPNKEGPLHWHPEFEIATAESSTLDFQVGQEHILLEAGDSIFVNGNILHGMKQLSAPSLPQSSDGISFDPWNVNRFLGARFRDAIWFDVGTIIRR